MEIILEHGTTIICLCVAGLVIVFNFVLVQIKRDKKDAERYKKHYLGDKKCTKACSPSDWYKGGRCHENGCMN